MRRPSRPVLVAGLVGAVTGASFYALDVWVETLPRGSSLSYTVETIEILLWIPGFALVAMLVTERIRLARAAVAEQRRSEQNRRLQMLGKIAAAMAHEVRNPLQNLRLVVDELRVSHPAVGADSLFPHVEDSIRRIDQAVGLIYTMARPAMRSTAIADLAQGVIRAVNDQAASPGRSDRIRVEAAVECVVRCSESDLRIMIGNLVRNACEAAGGREVRIAMEQDGRHGTVAVSNPGRLDAPLHGIGASSKSDGLGIGVLIVQELAAACGGGLELVQHEDDVRAILRLPIVGMEPA